MMLNDAQKDQTSLSLYAQGHKDLGQIGVQFLTENKFAYNFVENYFENLL